MNVHGAMFPSLPCTRHRDTAMNDVLLCCPNASMHPWVRTEPHGTEKNTAWPLFMAPHAWQHGPFSSAYPLDSINGDLNAHAPLLKFRNVVPKHIFPGITSVICVDQLGHRDFVLNSNQFIFKNNQAKGSVSRYFELLDRLSSRDRAQLELELISVNLFE